jgi:pimeloyl-ACP methyl ester carboxylesterase
MTRDRIHRAISDDGTAIAGRVHGHGPPLVLVHGALADGDSEWGAALPLLSAHFTCFIMSTRGRGLSGHSDDLSRWRPVEDVAAFVDSVGEPVCLAGVSGGGMNVLGAAARASAVLAAAVWEPPVFDVITDGFAALFRDTLARMQERYRAGAHVAAVTAFLDAVGNEEEVRALAGAPDELVAAAQYLAVDLSEIRQALHANGLRPTDPSVLATITAPVLLLHGTASKRDDWFSAGIRHAAAHVPNARVRRIPDVGHLTHLFRPEPLVNELREFFTATLAQP